jgi:hypothetical protein
MIERRKVLESRRIFAVYLFLYAREDGRISLGRFAAKIATFIISVCNHGDATTSRTTRRDPRERGVDAGAEQGTELGRAIDDKKHQLTRYPARQFAASNLSGPFGCCSG